ncbi:MAG: hypothetical protein IJF84_13445 [Thermoguttaceae bacterium]|nr:hypothetical protein [Thermoguttaceae bacterium]
MSGKKKPTEKKCQLCGKVIPQGERSYNRLHSHCDLDSGRKFYIALAISTTEHDEEKSKDAELCLDCLYTLLDMWNRSVNEARESEIEIRNLLIELSAKNERLAELLDKYKRFRDIPFEEKK